ncbi:hypothetical protein JAAARDRAFT_494470 [Jaapia argillacea MUCL 33604]|uniref:Uncharacterized protein n=1 Tax=Jaapia argillacea MUCL 33604 TaxID=933084 RepID=A0A067PAN5_9AGAM|nr:hypothetical protein JAAARDRAFT_494470 [Jaapia argillacea MUCL 33604]
MIEGCLADFGDNLIPHRLDVSVIITIWQGAFTFWSWASILVQLEPSFSPTTLYLLLGPRILQWNLILSECQEALLNQTHHGFVVTLSATSPFRAAPASWHTKDHTMSGTLSTYYHWTYTRLRLDTRARTGRAIAMGRCVLDTLFLRKVFSDLIPPFVLAGRCSGHRIEFCGLGGQHAFSPVLTNSLFREATKLVEVNQAGESPV